MTVPLAQPVVDTTPTFSDTIQNALPTWLGGTPVTANEAAVRQAAAAAQIQSVQTSTGAQIQAQTTLDGDTALVNGSVYTFSFQSSSASAASLLADVQAQAPDFIANPSTSQSGTTLVLQFTYEGDGTDLVQDVASSIVAAGLIVNNDPLTFLSASIQSGNSVAQTIAPTVAAQVTASGADQTALANSAIAAAQSSDSSQLTTLLFWAVIVIAGIIFVLPMVMKGLGSVSPRVSVGGDA